MVTAVVARIQLSRDLGDYFAGTTTATGGDPGKLKDDRLQEEDDDKFPAEGATIHLIGGQTGGPTSDEERGISTKAAGVLTMLRSWSVTVQASVNYTAHRLFRSDEKDDALTVALDLVVPIIFKDTTLDVTTVANQQDYDLSTASFYPSDEPHQVHLVSTEDTERTFPLSNWEMRGGKLHMGMRITSVRTLRCYGIKKAVITDISQPQLLIVTARAAMYLYEQAIASAPNDMAGRFAGLLTQATQTFAERVTRHMLTTEYGKTVLTDVYEDSLNDINWAAT